MANRSGPVQVCQMWVQGNCQRGERCRFSHQPVNGYITSAAIPGKAHGGISLFGKCAHADIPGLKKSWSISEHQRRQAGVSSAVLADDRLYVAHGDGHLSLWKSASLPTGGWDLQLCNEIALGSNASSLLFHSESKVLFCGLATGTIRCFRDECASQADLLGHTSAVTSLLIQESKLLSSSADGTCRIWSHDAAHGFICAATIQNPLGPISCIVATSMGLWMGCSKGVSCVNLQALQVTGGIEASAGVTKLACFQDSVIATYADGAIRIFDAGGQETKSLYCCGQATTAVAVLRHPHQGKHMLLCGHGAGCISVYDLPQCQLQGEFCSGYNGAVTAVVDLAPWPAFATCGAVGEVVIWLWEDLAPLQSKPLAQTME